ncbi:MAG: WD40 repeat domain-containing protein [Chloroflexi bacterium]|uniref:WD40 repeat domain-containing protein n=1 Tax=Candidatus Flexifilum breve TaxID=3140694 RepID=UPI003134E353|nr:WD40 repeat domain-containing protein [Chloroflexota bacterium]
MRYTRMLVLMLMLLMATVIAAQESDTDGDGIADSQDFCPQLPGSADLVGCTPETFPDFDQDTIADPLDSCPSDAGSAANNGCPDGVIPDYDADGLPDAQDQCPREYSPEVNGCPPDADADAVADFADACPTQPGVEENLGCPAGSAPPDGDADTVPDLFDQCPAEAGAALTGGCPDSDADGTVDTFDVCPAQAGDPLLAGCVLSLQATLPALTPINAGNAAAIRDVGTLLTGSGRMAMSGNRLAVRGNDQVYLYDLSGTTLTPTTISGTGQADYPISLSASGASLALLTFPADFSAPPFVQITDAATGADGSALTVPADNSGAAAGVSSFAFSPTDPALLVIAPLAGSPGAGVSAPAYDVAANQPRAQLTLPGSAVQVTFSRNGTRFALDTVEAGSMAIMLFDAGSMTPLGTINTGAAEHFIGTPLALNADGSRLAAGYPDGSVHVWEITGAPTELTRIPVFSGGEIVSAVAYSPDGSLIAVAGGVPFSGGLTGSEQFTLVLLDAATGAEVARWSAHDTLIRDLAFNEAGTLLISAGDVRVRLWGVG